MEGNPYAMLIQKLREDTQGNYPIAFRFGTVVSINPLKVEISSTIQGESDLLKDENIKDFEIGDTLLLIPIENDQRFIILCKVVSV